MPRMKTHSGAAKRFRLTGGGKLVRRRANRNHILGKKPSHRKRRLARAAVVSAGDRSRVRKMLGL